MVYRPVIVTFLLGVLVTGCGEGSAVDDLGLVVQGGAGKTAEVKVAPGRRFSLAVKDSPAERDSWGMPGLPDVKVASFISEEYRGASGAGGTHYFVFNAKYTGTTTIVLSGCPACSSPRAAGNGGSGRGRDEAVFRVTVA